jgi:hypothetical protein
MNDRRRASDEAFATSAFATTSLVGGELERVPASEAHAKLLGTTVAVCGRSTLTWFKFWAQPFKSVTGPRCRECLVGLGLTAVDTTPLVRDRHEAHAPHRREIA